ncbi:MAG: methyltransferase domain-containing protein [Spirulina sp. SIO3F2]|nr:methyltransferase domain-containing protein [Spirulina sp. SIO3F2]
MFCHPDIGYIPTPPAMVLTALAVGQVRPDDVVYDLGCGDGRVLIQAAQQFGVSGVGIEIQPHLVAQAQANATTAGVRDRVIFQQGNLFDCDFRPASLVFLYLLPHLNLRLRSRLVHQLQPGSRIVSRDFDMGADWPPLRTCQVCVEDELATLYYWEVPSPEERDRLGL